MEDKVLGLGKGIHRVPTVGSEGELLDCVNLIAKGGELVNAPRLEDTGKSIDGENAELMFVHKVGTEEHYVYKTQTEPGVRPLHYPKPIYIKKQCVRKEVDGVYKWVLEWGVPWDVFEIPSLETELYINATASYTSGDEESHTFEFNAKITVPGGLFGGEIELYYEDGTALDNVEITGGTERVWYDGRWGVNIYYVEELPVQENVTQEAEQRTLLTSNNEEVSGWWLMYQQGADNIAIDKIEGVIKKVSALGNVLVALTDVGMRYWLWNEGKYKPYNFEDVKDLGVQFGLEGKGEREFCGDVKIVKSTKITPSSSIITTKRIEATNLYMGVYADPQEIKIASQIYGYRASQYYDTLAVGVDLRVAGSAEQVLEKDRTYRIRIVGGDGNSKTLSPFTASFINTSTHNRLEAGANCCVYLSRWENNRDVCLQEINPVGKPFSVIDFKVNVENCYSIILCIADWDEYTIILEKISQEISEDSYSVDTSTNSEIEAVEGFANRFVDKIQSQGNKFMYPFLARAAIELTDNTFVSLGAPTLMIPSQGLEPVLDFSIPSGGGEGIVQPYISTIACDLSYRLLNNTAIDILRTMQEYVKGIVIAVSAPLYSYNQGATFEEKKQGMVISEFGGRTCYLKNPDGAKIYDIDGNEINLKGRLSIGLPKKDISKQIEEVENFYIIQSIPLGKINSNTWNQVVMENGILGTLLTQRRLTDNVITLDKYAPGAVYVYNNRLTIGNVKLEKFEGYSPALMNGSTSANIWQGDVVEVKSRVLLNINGKSAWTNWKVDHYYYENVPHLWFYYPHSGAKKAEIYVDAHPEGTHYCMHWEVDLTEHPHLNGAYAFMNFNDIKSNFRYITKDEYDAVVVSDADPLLYPNELMQSRVDNPFVLDGELSSFIGHGEIRALTSATKPVSQGQAGVAPINVFTSDGVWSVGVSKEGKMETVQASDREVILEGVEPLQTDDVVIFATNNGLRLLNGNEVTDISAVLDGYDEVNGLKNMLSQISEFEDFYGSSVVQSNTQQSFVDILPGCKMLWDGANKLVRVFSEGGCYVMDMVSGEWSRSTESMPLAVVAGFPYSIVQVEDKLMQYEKLKDNEDLREGVAIVRETAFGSPMYMKMLNDIRTIKKWHGVNGCVLRIVVFVSNDRVAWYRLRSLNAQSWKWYRVAIYSKMTDVDAVEGVICRTEERRGKKLR